MNEPGGPPPAGGARDRARRRSGCSALHSNRLPSGVVLVDDGGKIVLTNQQLEQQFGYPAGELIGQSRGRPAAPPRWPTEPPTGLRFSGAERPGHGRRSRPVRARRDGSRFPVEVRSDPGAAPIDGCIRCSRRSVDVTTRREREQGQRAAVMGKQEFERLIADMSVAVHQPAAGGGGRGHAGGPVADRGGPRPGSRDVLPHSGGRPVGRSGELGPRHRGAAPRSVARPRTSSRGPFRRCSPAKW